MMDYDPNNRIKFSHLTNNALVNAYKYSSAKKENIQKKKAAQENKKAPAPTG